MSKVVDLTTRFVPKVEIVFSCKHCNGQTFWIDEGGTVTCRACKARQMVDMEWLKDALQVHNNEGGEFKVIWEESDEDE